MDLHSINEQHSLEQQLKIKEEQILKFKNAFKNMIATDQADEFYNNRNLVEKAI